MAFLCVLHAAFVDCAAFFRVFVLACEHAMGKYCMVVVSRSVWCLGKEIAFHVLRHALGVRESRLLRIVDLPCGGLRLEKAGACFNAVEQMRHAGVH